MIYELIRKFNFLGVFSREEPEKELYLFRISHDKIGKSTELHYWSSPHYRSRIIDRSVWAGRHPVAPLVWGLRACSDQLATVLCSNSIMSVFVGQKRVGRSVWVLGRLEWSRGKVRNRSTQSESMDPRLVSRVLWRHEVSNSRTVCFQKPMGFV